MLNLVPCVFHLANMKYMYKRIYCAVTIRLNENVFVVSNLPLAFVKISDNRKRKFCNIVRISKKLMLTTTATMAGSPIRCLQIHVDHDGTFYKVSDVYVNAQILVFGINHGMLFVVRLCFICI